MARVAAGWALSLLLTLAVAATGAFPTPEATGPARRVYAPYFAGGISVNQAAILWFGEVTPATNYTDVRVAYNDKELWVHIAVFDRRLWYSTAPSADTLAAWDAATLLIGLDGNVGTVLNASDYRFTGQLNWWETPRTAWQAAWRGSDAGWSAVPLEFTTSSGWRGNAPNDDSDDRGWILSFRIPFASLGQSGKPPDGAVWGMAVVVHDRDDAAGTPLREQTWPENALPGTPATWGQLAFGRLPTTPSLAIPRGVTTTRQGLGGAVVPDSVVGGNTDCGSAMGDWWTEWGNKNYAGLDYFNVQNQFDVADWPCFSKYYVTFPLDSLPAGKAVISATLQLHQFGNAGAGWEPGPQPSYIQALTVAEDWEEATLTWNNAPMAEQNLAGTWVDPLGDTPPPEGSDRWWDVSGAVAEAYKAQRALRLVVYSADSDYHSGRYFRSSDFWDPADRPTLFVIWGDPILAPTGIVVSGPASGITGADYTFSASVTPVTATTPITYTWTATGLATQTHTGGGLSDSASFTWASVGAKTVIVTARNAAGQVVGSRNIALTLAAWAPAPRWSTGFGASTGWATQITTPRALADVNGDSRADVVGFGGTDVWVASSATGNSFGPMRSWSQSFCPTTGWVSQDTYPRLLADVNGDGKADVVGFGAAGVYVALATPIGAGIPATTFGPMNRWSTSFGCSPGAGSWTRQDLFPRLLADVNGDGKADVVGFGAAGVYVSLATPTGAGALATTLGPMRPWSTNFGYLPAAGGWANQNTCPRLLADVNGDGRADIVGFGWAGAYVSLSTGVGLGPMVRWSVDFGANTGWSSQETYPRTVADVNADGKADIVAWGAAGTYYSLSTGSAFSGMPLGSGQFGANPAAGGWSSQNAYPRLAADLNHDYKADLVGFGAAGVYVGLHY